MAIHPKKFLTGGTISIEGNFSSLGMLAILGGDSNITVRYVNGSLDLANVSITSMEGCTTWGY